MENLSEPARVFLISFLILAIGLGALNFIQAKKEHVQVQHIEHVIKTIQGQITLSPCLKEGANGVCEKFVARVSHKVFNEILHSKSIKLELGHLKLTLKKTSPNRSRKELSRSPQNTGHG